MVNSNYFVISSHCWLSNTTAVTKYPGSCSSVFIDYDCYSNNTLLTIHFISTRSTFCLFSYDSNKQLLPTRSTLLSSSMIYSYSNPCYLCYYLYYSTLAHPCSTATPTSCSETIPSSSTVFTNYIMNYSKHYEIRSMSSNYHGPISD